MLFVFLQNIASHMLFWALHLEAGSFPRPLSPRQEAEAFRALRAGDPQARDRIVAHIAKKYYASFGDQDDLISIGTIGLIKAVNSFDSEKQARFSTYASRCIENELRMQFRKVRRTPTALSLQDPLDNQEGGLTVMDVVTDNFLLDEDYEQQEEQLRLHEARRLMLFENERVSDAAFTVGYESITQFNREYKRIFGEPPLRDTNRRRAASGM